MTSARARRAGAVSAGVPRCLALLLVVVLGACGGGGDASSLPPLGALSGDVTEIHDPSGIVREGDRYYLFATHGPGIKRFSSSDLRTWTYRGTALEPLPAWVPERVPRNAGTLWAPDVLRAGGEWRLYYSASAFGLNESCIGLAVSPTLDDQSPSYGWQDRGPLLCTSLDDLTMNALDSHAFSDRDGRDWLVYGSFYGGIFLVELDPATGMVASAAAPLFLARKPELYFGVRGVWAVEAAWIEEHDGWYYLFVNWDRCCRGVESDYNIRVGRARRATGPYVDRAGLRMDEGGGTLVAATTGRFIGPGHAGIFTELGRSLFTFHFYDGENAGIPTLAIRELRWSPDGWPEVDVAER